MTAVDTECTVHALSLSPLNEKRRVEEHSLNMWFIGHYENETAKKLHGHWLWSIERHGTLLLSPERK